MKPLGHENTLCNEGEKSRNQNDTYIFNLYNNFVSVLP